MATKKTTITTAAQSTTRTPREPRVVSLVEQAIIDEANKQIKEGKSRIKETKALGKAIAAVNGLSQWGLEQVTKAIQARRESLAVSQATQA